MDRMMERAPFGLSDDGVDWGTVGGRSKGRGGRLGRERGLGTGFRIAGIFLRY